MHSEQIEGHALALRTNISSQQNGLAELAGDVLLLILQLRQAESIDDPARLRTRTLEALNNFERSAREQGTESDEIQNAKFALVAFIDEAIIGGSFRQKEEWMANPLQLELFGRNDAGEEFFRRVQDLRQRARANARVLEIYYLCMALGYKGKYLYDHPETLRQLVEDTKVDLLHGKGVVALAHLSPHGKPAEKLANVVYREIPAWVFGAGVAAVGVLFFVIMTLLMNGSFEKLRTLIERAG